MYQSFKSLLIISILVFISFEGNAKDDIKYPVSQIPSEMTENANSVVRKQVIDLEIISPSKFITNKIFAITILKESALNDSKVNIFYGKFNRISDIEVNVYNAAGEKVKRIKQDEILDISAIDNGTIYSDYRRKYIDPKHQNYPFTVEYQYTETYNSAFFLPSWTCFHGYNTSVENSDFNITYPESYDLRYKENKISQQKTDVITPGKKTLKWTVSNFKARNPEPYTPDFDEMYSNVYISPSGFEIDDYTGKMNSWQDFGEFISILNEKKNNLPEETKEKVKALVKDCKDDYEKVKLIYEYAQKKNRYVSIQVGIGGWQSIDSETVDRLSYGDCKALSNYTKSLLEAAGLKALCALVQAGEGGSSVKNDFTRNGFNHMIACVPLAKDTIWLECTNSFIPAGYMGSFTDDRMALLLEGSNSRLVKTPSFSKTENEINTTGEVVLKADGNATGNFSCNFNGSFYGDVLRLKLIDEEDRKNAIIHQIKVPNFKLTGYDIQENKCRKPSMELNINLEMTNYCTMMGSRLLVRLNQLNPMSDVPRNVRKREFNLEIKRARVENDTINFQLPAGYQVEALPEPVELKTDFGSFKCVSILNNDRIRMIRHLEIYKGVSLPEKYNEFREFLEKVAISDNSKCLLVKNL
jgi:hypothetical protein